MGTKFPIVVKMTAKSFEELEQCEFGSYEDHIREEQCPWCESIGLAHGMDMQDCPTCGGEGTVVKRQAPYDKGRLHIVELIQRSKNRSKVLLQSQEEVEEFFVQACTGTFGLYRLRVCRRVWQELSPHVSEEIVKRIPYGSLGY